MIVVHQLPYFGSSTISLAIPREDIAYARKALDKAAGQEARLRWHTVRGHWRHKVRGHWRVIERGKPVSYLCRHLPTMVAMTDEDDDRAEYIERLLSARIPELSEADIAALVRPDSDAIPVEIGDKIAAVIEALEAKLAALERRLAA